MKCIKYRISLSIKLFKKCHLSDQISGCESLQTHWQSLQSEKTSKSPPTPSVIIPYVNDAINWIIQSRQTSFDTKSNSDLVSIPGDFVANPGGGKVEVLVTGSLHLVGGVLELIQPDVCYKSQLELDEEQDLIKMYYQLENKDNVDIGKGQSEALKLDL